VKAAFNDHVSELQTILNTFTVQDIFDILHYIKDEAPLSGLPLFILADNSLVFLPRISERPVYHSETRSHCVLFSSTAFLHNTCSEEIIQALTKDASVNLQIFRDTSVPKLVEVELEGLKDAQARAVWLNRFWEEYDGLPGPPPLSLLERPNLKLLSGESSHLSLEDCQPDTVVRDPGDNFRSMLVPILKKLDINVLKYHSHPTLIKYINERLPSLLVNVLKCFKRKDVLSFPRLNEDEHRELASWMRSAFLPWAWVPQLPIETHLLLRLPIWEAQLGGRQQLHPASDLHVLPDGFAMGDISHYLNPNIAVAPNGSFFYHSDRSDCLKPMSPYNILNVVRLPAILRDNLDCQRYKNFLKAMIALPEIHTVKAALRFPDCNGTLRVISDLYDYSVPLFAEDLKYTEQSSFLHPYFRDLSLPDSLGFQHEITFSTFKKCAETIEALGYDPSFLADTRQRNDLMEMAKVTFDCYKTTLPALLMTNQSLWRQLDAIAFVRPKADRRQGASYHVDLSYCTHLSQLLSPSQIIRPEFEPIAWTQFALPLERISEEVLAVNRNLGVPKASVIVSLLFGHPFK